MQKKILSIVLTLCMLLSMFPFAMSASAVDTGNETVLTSTDVVYVSESEGASTNDGLTAATAFKSLTQAYQALAANGGTIVICDEVTLDSTAGVYPNLTKSTHTYYAAPECGGPVKITAKNGSEDFTSTAILKISIFAIRSAHIIDDIKIESLTTAAGISALGNDLTIGENVTCLPYSGGQYPMILSGLFQFNTPYLHFGTSVDSIVWKSGQVGFTSGYTNPVAVGNYSTMIKGTDNSGVQDIVVNSGTWRNIRGGNWRSSTLAAYQELDHTVNITINGGTVNPVTDNIQICAMGGAYATADASANLTINGGTFNGVGIYTIGRNGVTNSYDFEGTSSLTINGGNFNGYTLIAAAQGKAGSQVATSLPTDTTNNLKASGASTMTITGGTFGNDVGVKSTATGAVSDVFTGPFTMAVSGNAATALGTNLYTSTFDTVNDYCTLYGHSYVNNVCEYCGTEKPNCQHPSTHQEITLAPTCTLTGLANLVCDECGEIATAGVTVPVDLTNHVGQTVDIVYNEEGSIDYVCSGCGTVLYSDTTFHQDVYYSAAGNIVDIDHVPTTDIGNDTEPFADFNLAMKYAGASAEAYGEATLHVVDTANIGGSYSTPAFAGKVTITGGTLHFNEAPRRFYANGDITFENTTFTTNATDGLFIFGQNHNLVFGEGITMGNEGTLTTGGSFPRVNNVKAYVFGGFENLVPDTMDTNITVRSGEYWFIGGWNRNCNAVGGYEGTGNLTIGKTNPADTLITNYLVPFSTGTQYLSDESTVNVTVDGDAEVRLLILNSQNAGSADVKYNTNFILKGNLNAVNNTILPDITNTTTVKDAVVNVYTDARLASAVEDETLFFGANADTSIATLGFTMNQYTYAKYCLDVLGGHFDANNDVICDECGASLGCAHDNVSTVIDLAPTCVATGLAHDVCNDCGVTTVESYTLAINPANHVATGAVWAYDAETATYSLTCPACNAVVATQAEAPVVYVDAANGADTNPGLTTDAAVATLAEAVTRLSVTGGSVTFVTRYVISEDINLPAWSQNITFTSVLSEENTATTGFVTSLNGATLNLNGPTTFQKLIFNNSNSSSAAGYNTLVIAAHWNDVTFGDSLGTFGGCYFIAGSNNDSSVTEDSAEKTVNFTFNHTAAGKVRPGGGDLVAITFFQRIILGNRANAAGTTSNKTVVANFINATAIDVWAGTTSSAAIDAQTVNCSTTLNFTADANIKNIRTGAENASGGTSSLDNLTLNLAENSRIYGSILLYNAKNAVIDISNAEEGRTTNTIVAPISVLMSDEYAAVKTGNETATVTYNTHSIASATEFPVVSADYAATINKTDDCTYDEGVITTPATLEEDGVKTYTCTVCGRTFTETVEFACTDHAYIAKADGTFYCAICGATAESVTAAPVMIKAAPVTVANGVATVDINLEATTGIWATRFTVNAPEGFTLTNATSTLSTPESGNGFAFVGGETYALPYEIAIANMDATNLVDLTFADATVVTLTFAVAETVADGVYVLTVTPVETVNVSDELVETKAISAEMTVATVAHEHSYDAGVVTIPATCTEAGVMTFTCECGDSYTEAIPAIGHDYDDGVVTTPATCTEAGVMTFTCANCGDTYTEVIEAYGHKYGIGEITTPATCTEAGVMTFTCANCGDAYTEVIPATGHSFGEWVVTTPAQPGVAGVETRYCANCDETETRPIEALPVNYVAYVGETGYATVQAAINAVPVLGTVTVEADTTETVTPAKTFYFAGDYDGITISGTDYTMDITGRYARSDNEIVEDTVVPYASEAIKVIVRPTATTAVDKNTIPATAALALLSAIQVQFGTTKSVADSFADFYAVIELVGADGTTVTSTDADAEARRQVMTDKVVSVANAEKYEYVFDGTPAKCMNNTIKITFYAINADGSVLSREINYGIYTYLNSQLNKSPSENYKQMLAAILNYGALAQNFFNYNTENLVNANLDASLVRSTVANFADTAMAGTVGTEALTTETALFRSTGISLELLDRVSITLAPKAQDGASTDYSNATLVYTYTDADGELQTVAVPYTEWTMNGTAPTIRINQVAARDLRASLTVNIYNNYGTAEQSRIIKSYIMSGAEYYCTLRQSKADATDAEKSLYFGLLRYSDTARTYFANPTGNDYQ